MRKNKKFTILFILLTIVFSFVNSTPFVAFASNDISGDDYYAFVEKKRTISKNGEIENVLIFRVDANAYSKIRTADMPLLDEFLAKASTAIKTIRESFPEAQVKKEIINPKSKVEIVLSRYANSEELNIRNGFTDLDKPKATSRKEKGIVYNKIISNAPYFFTNIENETIQECINTFKAIDSNQDRFLYTETYVYPYSFNRLSTNADKSYKDLSRKLYVHQYFANGTQLSQLYNRDLVFTQTVPNPAFWYGIAIGGGIVILVVSVVILLIYQKKKSSKNIQAETNID